MRIVFLWQAARETRGQEAARPPPNLSHEDKISKLADMGFLPQQVVSKVERGRAGGREGEDGCACVRARALLCEDVLQCACADALKRRKRGGVLCRAMSTDAHAKAEQALLEADNTDMRELAHEHTHRRSRHSWRQTATSTELSVSSPSECRRGLRGCSGTNSEKPHYADLKPLGPGTQAGPNTPRNAAIQRWRRGEMRERERARARSYYERHRQDVQG